MNSVASERWRVDVWKRTAAVHRAAGEADRERAAESVAEARSRSLAAMVGTREKAS